ncbi:MAG: hypothetical protein ACR2PO_17145 [Methyloligellaceae bacterium]
MTSIEWRPVGSIDPRELGKGRHQAHNAVQWLARMARSYVEPADDDSHTALDWAADDGALVTKEIAPDIVLEFRLPELTMQFKEGGKRVSHKFDMDDRSPAEAEAWLLVELLHRGVDREKLSKDLPYSLPGMMVGDAVHYDRLETEELLRELTQWYANGASAIEAVCKQSGAVEGGRPTVTCRPRYFDLVASIPLPNGGGQASAIKVGLAPGDGHYGEPYFYVVAQPELDAADLPELPEVGHWHTKDFVGAILPASRIVEYKLDGDDVVAFLSAAIAAVRD